MSSTGKKDAQSLKIEDDEYEVEETKHEVKTDKCGLLTVYVQGNVNNVSETTPVFLTVHDIGCNHTEFHKLTAHPAMSRVRERSVFIHVEIPGQEYDALDLPEDYKFPSMQDFGEDLVYVLDYFRIKCAVTLGEGAGANILARFAMAHPDRVLGNVLIHCTSTVAGMMEYLNDRVMNRKLSTVGMTSWAEQYLVFHKFGQQLDDAEHKEIIQAYIKKLYSRMNPRNLRLFIEAFLNRTDISEILREKMKVDTLLVTGARASHVHTVHTMHSHMDPKKTTLFKVDDTGDVIIEAPDTLAWNIILFCQGLGLMSWLPISRHGSISN